MSQILVEKESMEILARAVETASFHLEETACDCVDRSNGHQRGCAGVRYAKEIDKAIAQVKANGDWPLEEGNKTEPPVVKQGTTLCRHGVPTDERCQLCRDELIYIPEEKK